MAERVNEGKGPPSAVPLLHFAAILPFSALRFFTGSHHCPGHVCPKMQRAALLNATHTSGAAPRARGLAATTAKTLFARVPPSPASPWRPALLLLLPGMGPVQ